MEKVNAAREKELKSIVKLWGAYIAFGTIGYGGGLVIAFVTFLTYTVVFGHTLDAATAFTAINLLHVVSGLLSFLPHEIMQIYKAKVALERILAFLSEEELEKYLVEGPEKDLKEKSSYSSLDTLIQEAQDSFTVMDDDGTTVGFKGASFAYHGEKQNVTEKQDSIPSIDETLSATSEDDVLRYQPGFQLNNIDVEFPIAGLSLVCGPTGSGKTSIILALLGGMF
jgi:ABC-type multidrug transport system fused ATPase/permease subunit